MKMQQYKKTPLLKVSSTLVHCGLASEVVGEESTPTHVSFLKTVLQ